MTGELYQYISYEKAFEVLDHEWGGFRTVKIQESFSLEKAYKTEYNI